MKIVVNLKDSVVLEVTKLADQRNVNVETMIETLIMEALNKRNKNKKAPSVKEGTSLEASNSAIAVLLYRVKRLESGAEFTVKELIHDKWDTIHNVISFGRKAAKALSMSKMATDIPSSASSRRYRRK